MIKSFRHAGLEKLFKTGSKKGINPSHAVRLSRQLVFLDAATEPAGMNVPGWNLHALQGELSVHWSVKVNGNWQMTFRSEDEDAVLVDYQD